MWEFCRRWFRCFFSRSACWPKVGLLRAVKRDYTMMTHTPDTTLARHNCRLPTSHVVDFVQRRTVDFTIIAFVCQTRVAHSEQQPTCTRMVVMEKIGNQQQRIMPGSACSRPPDRLVSPSHAFLDVLIRTRVRVPFSAACLPLVSF